MPFVDDETDILVRDEKKLRAPRDCVVVLLNDDYTSMDFVVEILQRVFHKREDEAARIMLNVHEKGRGVAGAYSWDIAQTKAAQVHKIAAEHEYPLRCVVEEG